MTDRATALRARADELERLHLAATEGPWVVDSAGRNSADTAHNVILCGPDDKPKILLDSINSELACIEYETDEWVSYFDSGTRPSFSLIVALRNAAPAIIATLRALADQLDDETFMDDCKCESCQRLQAAADMWIGEGK